MTEAMRDDENILAVTHAGPIECVLQKICGVPMDYFLYSVLKTCRSPR